MTDPELTTLLKDLFAHFPVIDNWLTVKSSNPEKTLEGWKAVLRPLDYGKCDVVLTRWINGQLEMPKGYEFNQTAVIMRREVSRLEAAELNQRDLFEMRREREQARKQAREFARPARELMSDMSKLRKEAEKIHDPEERRRWLDAKVNELEWS